MEFDKKIDPKHTAVVVVDMQKDFVDPEGAAAKRGRDMSASNALLEKLPGFLEEVKKKGVLTLYTQQIYDREKQNELQLEQYDLDGKFISCDVNTDGWHLYGVDAPEGDLYIKHDYNIFSAEGFKKRLEKEGIKTLIITGVETIFCIETAVRSAFDLGYKVVVPKDLIAGNPKYPELNNHTLTMIERFFGVLTTKEEIIDTWNNK